MFRDGEDVTKNDCSEWSTALTAWEPAKDDEEPESKEREERGARAVFVSGLSLSRSSEFPASGVSATLPLLPQFPHAPPETR